jgi:hypothetical protein
MNQVGSSGQTTPARIHDNNRYQIVGRRLFEGIDDGSNGSSSRDKTPVREMLNKISSVSA